MNQKRLVNVLVIVVAVVVVASLVYFVLVQKPVVPKTQPSADAQVLAPIVGFKGVCPRDGRFEGSDKRIEDVYNESSRYQTTLDVLNFVVGHPIVCEISGNYQLILKVEQVNSQNALNTRIDAYLRNHEGRETPIPNLNPVPYTDFAVTSGGIEAVFFEVKLEAQIDFFFSRCSDNYCGQSHTLVDFISGSVIRSYEVTGKKILLSDWNN